MNGLERILAALDFKKPDRVPVFLNNTFSSAALVGTKVSKLCRNTDLFTQVLLEGYRRYGYDGIRVGADVTTEAEAMGCTASFPEDGIPGICNSIVKTENDFHKLKMPNPYTDGRMPMVLEATRRCSAEMGSEGFVCSLVMGPVNIASQLMGVENMLVTSMMEPEYFEKVLEFTSEVTVNFAQACVRSGAHGVVMGEATCSASMLGPAIYEEYIQRIHKRVIDELRLRGVKYTTLHICGKLENQQLDMIANTGVTALDVDTPVDMSAARAFLGNRMAFIGNISTTELLTKSPEFIDGKCKEVLDSKNLGLILGAGCTMGPATPEENVAALVNSAKKYGVY